MLPVIFCQQTSNCSSGASGDLKQATWFARKMVTDLGMSDKLGPRTFGDKQELIFLGREISETKDYSERTALEIDKEMDKIISGSFSLQMGKPTLL